MFQFLKQYLLLTVLCMTPSHQGEHLHKKYTLIVPLMLPISGPSSMQAWGVPAIDFAVQLLNNQTRILPNYNIVVNVGDDRCSDAPAVRSAMNLFMNYQPVRDLTSAEGTEFGSFQPANRSYAVDTARYGYGAPIFLGGLCSAACTSTGRFPQHFNFIDVTHSCNDPSLIDRKKFPNFYRFLPSLIRVSTIRVEFVKLMQWSKVGIISDTLAISYADVLNLMRALQTGQVDILAVEFFADNPDEAVQRIKQSGSRIIFATCYNSICPAMGCAALKHGVHGPKYVWIFRTATDLLSAGLLRTNDCTKAMTDHFAERSLYIGADNDGFSLVPENVITSTGISLRQFQDYVDARSKGVPRNANYQLRMFVFENVHTAAHILHDVETELNKRNETLHQLIVDRSRAKELEELIRSKTLTVDTNGLYGRTAFLPGTLDPYSPNIIIDQVQNGVRRNAWLYDKPNAKSFADRFTQRLSLKWDTPTKQPPKSHISYSLIWSSVQKSYVIANFVFGALLIVTLLNLEISRRFSKKTRLISPISTESSTIISSDLCTLSSAATIVVQAAVFTYPIDAADSSFDHFCKGAPFLVLFGSTTVASSLSLKVWSASADQYPRQRSHVALSASKRFKQLWHSFLAVFISLTILVAWYASSTLPNKISIERDSADPFDDDTIVRELWFSCQIESGGASWLAGALGYLALIYLFGVATVFTRRQEKFPQSSGIREAGVSLYILLTLTIICIIAVAIVNDPNTLFATLVVYCYGVSLITAAVTMRQTLVRLVDLNRKRQVVAS